jgi:hypothetical protein
LPGKKAFAEELELCRVIEHVATIVLHVVGVTTALTTMALDFGGMSSSKRSRRVRRIVCAFVAPQATRKQRGMLADARNTIQLEWANMLQKSSAASWQTRGIQYTSNGPTCCKDARRVASGRAARMHGAGRAEARDGADGGVGRGVDARGEARGCAGQDGGAGWGRQRTGAEERGGARRRVAARAVRTARADARDRYEDKDR